MIEGSTLDDRYEILDLAGRGGMASVYRARDRQSGGTVAVKIMATTEPSDLARFDREARVLMRLAHPNVVAYHGRGVTSDGRPFLILDWLEGETLAERLAAGLPPLSRAIELVTRVARALGHAHAQNVVHRDLKPSNVFLVGPGYEEPRLLDFGVARVLAGTKLVTRSGTALGTPAYMAPEQARGLREVDARADVYALGCLLYECVSGERPFDGDDVMAVLAKVLFEEAPRLSSAAAGIPEALDDLVERMMSKDARRRPANGDEVADLLTSLALELDMPEDPVRMPSNRPPRPLTTREQKLVAVVAGSPAANRAERIEARGANAPTVAAEAAINAHEFATEAASYGARFASLADGSCIAVLEVLGSATDLALRAARCALALSARRPEMPLALAMGRATSDRVPVGEVIDRVAELLRGSVDAGSIRVDELVAGLLDRRFVIVRTERALFLERETGPLVGPRLLLGKPTPCVGRARELRMLAAFYEECAFEPASSLAIVTGSAGMGKTRLTAEWLQRIESADPAPVVWLGRGDPITAGSPLALIGSALRPALGLEAASAVDEARERILARVARTVGEADAKRVSEFLGEIVGVPFPGDESLELRAARTDPTLMGDQLRRAFEDFVLAEATARPLVLVLEDCHWGDTASIRLVEHALGFARQRALAVVVVGRPEVTTLFPSLTRIRGALALVVGELSRKHCELFVDEVLEGIDPDTRARVLDHAGGNAFFLEELVRFVADLRDRASGSARETIMPPTVIAMLQSRLETLPAATRRFLRAASVFGNAFWLDGVASLLGEQASSSAGSLGPSDPAGVTTPASGATGQTNAADLPNLLDRLMREELVEPRAPSRMAGQTELAFRHALVRDAAYQMLTERDSIAGHRLAGEWLEGAGEHDAFVLGEHFERGHAYAKAARWFTDAAATALERHDFAGAVGLISRATKADVTGVYAGRLALLESDARRWAGDLSAAEASARRALELLPQGSAAWFTANEQLASAAGVHGDYRPAVLWRERIAAVPCEPGAESARLLALAAVGRRLFQLGDYTVDEVVDYLIAERAALAERLEPRAVAEIERLLGARARHRGDVAGDLAGYRAAELAYEAAGDVRNACNALVSVGFSYVQLGDHAAARRHLERALAQAERLGLAPVETRARQNLALVLLAEGSLEEARRTAEGVLAQARSRGDVRFEGWTRIYLSRILRAAGDARSALEEATRALDALGSSPPAYAGALAARALAAVDAGDPTEGDVAAREAMAILEEYEGIEEFESLVLAAAVRAATASGQDAEARALAVRARQRLAERAGAIDDPALAKSFLSNVPENVELANACFEALRPAVDPAVVAEGPPARVEATWSADAFDNDASVIVDRLRRHLTEATSGRALVTRGFPGPDAMLAATPGAFGEEPITELSEFLEGVIARSPWQHHPRYVGHQVSAAIPRAALLGLVAQVLNNGMAAFEAGPAIVALERRIIEWMLSKAGFPETGGGVLTSGGSLGNLTALLAARKRVDPEGRAQLPPAILVSEQAHYSNERAAQIMGLGRDAVFPVATDARYRIDTTDLAAARRRAIESGRAPFAVVASAGATGTGSIDPLEDVADFAADHGLWMHVDGAHGASALLSKRYAPALRGIERADSLVWDAHKLMSMPALATAVLFRDGAAPYATFAQNAAYLFEERTEPPWFDIGLRTIECTKPLIALPLYGCLATLGTRVFEDAVDVLYDLARSFAERIASEPDFELACAPDSNIVCFRFRPPGSEAPEAQDALQRRVRDELRKAGAFYVVLTTLRGRVHLRVSLMNPRTTLGDLEALVAAIRDVGVAPCA